MLPDEPAACGKVIIAADQLDQWISDAVLVRLDSPKLAKALRTAKRAASSFAEDPAEIIAEIDELDAAVARGDVSLRSQLTIRKGYEARLTQARSAQAETDDVSVLAPFANGHAYSEVAK